MGKIVSRAQMLSDDLPAKLAAPEKGCLLRCKLHKDLNSRGRQ